MREGGIYMKTRLFYALYAMVVVAAVAASAAAPILWG